MTGLKLKNIVYSVFTAVSHGVLYTWRGQLVFLPSLAAVFSYDAEKAPFRHSYQLDFWCVCLSWQ